MIVLLSAALIGGLATAVALWPHGAVVALICAPFGACLLTAVAAVLLALSSRAETNKVRSGSRENMSADNGEKLRKLIQAALPKKTGPTTQCPRRSCWPRG